jgi:transcription antitermination factor NusG
MSDDLVKRLRMVTGFIRFETGDRIAASACLSEEAADHIEQLAAINEELEAKLSKAVVALEVWCGNPRNMRDEDLAFFGLERSRVGNT